MAKRYIPNAWETHGTTYHVAQNHPKASDDNPGTEGFPFKTISAAAGKVKDFDQILIDEGVYREQVPITGHGYPWEPNSLLLFRAVPGKEVYLLGSDPFDAEWEEVAAGTYKTQLPASLFVDGTYNPYELSCVIDEPGKVRPADGPELPEILGQIYVDDEPLEQLTSVQGVTDTPNSFVVSADGKEIICHFPNGKAPAAGTVELSIREQCFKPTFEVDKNNLYTIPWMQTKGMVVERAADPGAFSTCRPLVIRKNPGTGIVVRKTLDSIFRDDELAIIDGNVSYLSKDKPTIFCPRLERSIKVRPNDAKAIPMVSDDGTNTWKRHDGDNLRPAFYFLDRETGILIRHWRDALNDDLLGSFAANVYTTYYQLSSDGGQTWSEPEKLPLNKTGVPYGIIKLQNGQLLWCTSENIASPPNHFGVTNIYLGTWRDDLSGIDWVETARIEGKFNQKPQSIGEPHACQFADGRIFIVFRMLGITPAQNEPGIPALKSFAISEDNGRTWTKPATLCYEDGSYVYSSASYPDTFCSSKNGKPYVIININEKPTMGCDPRSMLQIAELSTDPVAVKRDTVAIIDEKLPEHHHMARYSNWILFEERETKNMMLFMKFQMSESSPIRNGYDFNCHRYEIILPE